MTNSQTAVSFCGSCSGESNHCGVLLKVDDQLVDGNMVHISSTKFYYFWSRVSSWMSQWALALQELRLLLVTLSFNSEDKPKAITLTAFLGTSGSTCACKSLCPPLLELPSWGFHPATLPMRITFFLCCRVITCRGFADAEPVFTQHCEDSSLLIW